MAETVIVNEQKLLPAIQLVGYTGLTVDEVRALYLKRYHVDAGIAWVYRGTVFVQAPPRKEAIGE